MRKTQFTILGAAALALSLGACKQQDTGAPEKPGQPVKKDDKTAKADDKKPGDKTAPAKTGPLDKTAAVLAVVKNHNEGKTDDAMKDYADDVVLEFVGSPEPPASGKEAAKKDREAMLAAFPDLKIAFSRVIEAGNTVLAQGVITGTHKGEFQGTAATDKPIGAEFLVAYEFDGDKIKKIRRFVNQAALMAQIGAIKDAPVPPVPETPTGEPELIKGAGNPANVELVKTAAVNWVKDGPKGTKDQVTEGFKHHATSDGKVEATLAEQEKSYKELKTGFPDFAMEITRAESVGDYVVVEATCKGTHKGSFGGIKATNKPVEIHYTEVNKIEGGKIAESWGYLNQVELLGQLGLLPPKGGDQPVAQK